jgi:uncharacterized protein (DUF2147 family)
MAPGEWTIRHKENAKNKRLAERCRVRCIKLFLGNSCPLESKGCPRIIVTRALYIVAILLLILATPLTAQETPIGLWRSVSDVDGKPIAVVEISESGGSLRGTVKEILVPTDSADRFCGQCTGDRKDKPIIGMQIVWDMRPDGDGWSGGSILDPDNGKIYKGKMWLSDNGKKLMVRGFIGIPLFGRSQTWLRVE